MRCERLTADQDPARTAAALRALIPAPDSVRDDVTGIIASVRSGGDEALRHYTRKFDTAGAEPAPLLVAHEELEAAAGRLDREVEHGILRAIENVEAVSIGWRSRLTQSAELGSGRVVLRSAPVARAAVYVPGGRAPYPSTVVMGVVPARMAGVEHISVCAPPREDGDVDPVVLAACRLTGVSTVYRMGGAHAIAALAYGTESVTPVDMIVGPGNLYVQEAKRQVFGQVGIDGFAGPSDLLAIATHCADGAMLALDLLAQAEHGPGTLVIAVSDAPELLDALEARLSQGEATGAVACVVATSDLEQALAVAQAFAPEHLQLVGERA